MVDNRSAGFFGIGGAFNFKSGDISGTAAKTQDDKMGQGGEYFAQGQKEDEQKQDNQPFIDRSAQLRATLNSLAMMNVAGVLNEQKRAKFLDEASKKAITSEYKNEDEEDKDEEFLNDFDNFDNDNEDNEYY